MNVSSFIKKNSTNVTISTKAKIFYTFIIIEKNFRNFANFTDFEIFRIFTNFDKFIKTFPVVMNVLRNLDMLVSIHIQNSDPFRREASLL